MKLHHLFENTNHPETKANLQRAYERILEVVKTMSDRLDPKKAAQVKSIQQKLRSMMQDPVMDDQANNYAEQVHTFVQKLFGLLHSVTLPGESLSLETNNLRILSTRVYPDRDVIVTLDDTTFTIPR